MEVVELYSYSQKEDKNENNAFLDELLDVTVSQLDPRARLGM